MSAHETDPIGPESPNDTPPAPEEPRKRYEGVSVGRRSLWVVGGLVGVYMIGRGLYGVITGEDEQP